MIEQISLIRDNFLLHPFRAEEMERFDKLSLDIFDLFNQSGASLFLPHKKLTEVVQAETFLQHALLNQHAGMSHLHFITELQQQKTIGMIELISPKLAKKHYKLKSYPYFLEFCLCDAYAGKGIMSGFLQKFSQILSAKGIKRLAAVASPHNLAAIRVLQKSGINLITEFDAFKNLYHN